jgi:flagellar protein FliJ
MGYRFRFQVLLDRKARLVEEREQALARQQAELSRLQEHLQQLQAEQEQTMRRLQASLLGTLCMHEVDQTYRYLGSLARRIEVQYEQICLCSVEVEARRQALTEALKERKTLEKLKEYGQKTYEDEVHRQEVAVLDDLNITRHRRKRP